MSGLYGAPGPAATPPAAPAAATFSRRNLGRMAAAAGAAAVAGGLVGGAATALGLSRAGRVPAGLPGLPGLPGLGAGRAAPGGATVLYKQVAPSVVVVRTNSGEGSGFIADGQGHVITNNHVISGTTRAMLRLVDGTNVPAEVVTTDTQNDLAVLKADLPAGKTTVAVMGDSDAVTPGDTVVAIGSPFGHEHSVTSGIVSAVDRQSSSGRGQSPIQGMIQTDAAINPGNSGGPLFNTAGQVIGINTMGISPVRASVGVAFAVPVNAARRLLEKAGR
ncbi:MAG TPA: trypsin-like peptidase domain-containing protein [Chloroflexota bacterium]|nr:trypsin-like peptidase domain-containing protein [Chloroflexota bacterium]